MKTIEPPSEELRMHVLNKRCETEATIVAQLRRQIEATREALPTRQCWQAATIKRRKIARLRVMIGSHSKRLGEARRELACIKYGITAERLEVA